MVFEESHNEAVSRYNGVICRMRIGYSAHEILTNEDIGPQIIKIIKEAEEYCVIATPFLKIWTHLDTVFKIASDEKKKIMFFFRQNQDTNRKYSEEKLKDLESFQKKYNFDVFFVQNLHAKIYGNEKEILLSSMNLYEYSQGNSYEIGTLIKNEDIVKEITEKIITNEMIKQAKYSEGGYLKGNHYELIETNLFFEKEIRYCVNCRKPFKYNRNYDTYRYCNDCNEKYKTEKGVVLNGNYCNKCGKAKTPDHKPFCLECWQTDRDKNRASRINESKQVTGKTQGDDNNENKDC